MRMSLKQLLEMMGLKVETAEDGLAALERVRSGLRPHLVITDVNMPRMNGMELIRELRVVLRFTPILVLTTESGLALREEGRKLGATGWIVKPVKGEDLMAVVRRLLPES